MSVEAKSLWDFEERAPAHIPHQFSPHLIVMRSTRGQANFRVKIA
jgi:hypothetical protein